MGTFTSWPLKRFLAGVWLALAHALIFFPQAIVKGRNEQTV